MKTLFRKHSIMMVLTAVFIASVFLTGGRMLYPQNLSNLLLQNAYVLILACGMLMCILTGGNIDLSVGSTACLVGAVCAQLLNAGLNWFLVIVIGIVIGLCIGIWNGFLIGRFQIPSFVCTLAGMFAFRGLARAVLHSKTVAVTNEKFLDAFASYIRIPGLDDGTVRWSCFILGIIISAVIVSYALVIRYRRKLLVNKIEAPRFEILRYLSACALALGYTWALANYKGIPIMAVWVVVIIFIYAFITSQTALGRYFYAVGDNEKAAALSGIETWKIYFLAYTSMSVLAALCGMITAARIGSVNGDTGNAFEMDAIAACFIGGASAYGGSGSVYGIVVGAVLLGVINQGMSIIGLDSNWQFVVKGVVLLSAVIFDVAVNRKRRKE